MYYSFFLLPEMSMPEKRNRVAHVMELLHLQPLKNTFVGGSLSFGVNLRGISGGQKRRVSIAYVLPLFSSPQEPSVNLFSKR